MKELEHLVDESQPTMNVPAITSPLTLESQDKARGMDAALRLNLLLKHTNCVFGFKLLGEYLRLVSVLDVDRDGWIKVVARAKDGYTLRVEISQSTPFYFYPLFGK